MGIRLVSLCIENMEGDIGEGEIGVGEDRVDDDEEGVSPGAAVEIGAGTGRSRVLTSFDEEASSSTVRT